MLEEKCGNCKWAQLVKQDLTKRLCHGGPPQVVLVPTAAGPEIQVHWPLVSSEGHICSLFKPKISALTE